MEYCYKGLQGLVAAGFSRLCAMIGSLLCHRISYVNMVKGDVTVCTWLDLMSAQYT